MPESNLFIGEKVPAGWRLLHGFSDVNKESTRSFMLATLQNTTTQETKLWLYENPIRPYWVTAPAFRNHTQKRLGSSVNELLQFHVPEHELGSHIFEQLHGFKSNGKVYLRQILNSPFIYGADIPVTVIKRWELMQRTPKPISKLRVGMFDSETSMCGGREMIVTSYVDPEGHVYLGALNSFLKEGDVERIHQMYEEAKLKLPLDLKPKALKMFNACPWDLTFRTFDREIDMIIWIFQCIHQTKPDFVGVWNLAHDAEELEARIEHNGKSCSVVMCHPDVPPKYRYYKWFRSERQVDHFTHHWHWLTIAGYTQFVDCQNLYSILRKVKGKDISYRLDYIAEKELGIGKLETPGGHQYMQTHKFAEYTVYGAFDSILIKLMDMVNNDVLSLVSLSGPSDLNCFTMQTKRLQFELYTDGSGYDPPFVPSAIGSSQETELDKRIPNVGGGVLSPLLAKNTGVAILQEIPVVGGLNKFVADADGTSLYPSLTAEMNVDRDTKTATLIPVKDGITSEEIEDICSNAASMAENAVYLGNRYFRLPNYSDTLSLYDASLTTNQ